MKESCYKMENSKRIQFSEVLVIILTWFAASASLLDDTINQVALYTVLPLAFIISLKSYGMQVVRQNVYFKLLFILYLWILFSVSWASYTDIAIRQMRQILGAFLLCFIVASQGRHNKMIPYLYSIYIILLLGDWYYAYNNILSLIEVGYQRLNDDKLNANVFGYHTFYVTFAIFILGEVLKTKGKIIMRFAFWLTIPLSIITALYTASRQILIIQVPLILLLLYIRYMWYQSLAKKCTILAFITICSAILFIPQFDRVYEGSLLQQRNSINSSDDSRLKLAEEAFDVGIEYFPLGVGPGNYVKYSASARFSHNTYMELFANEGPIGLLLYLAILFIFISRQRTRYKKTKDKNFLAFMLFGIIYTIDGIFYVFFNYLWLISFLILVATHSETYYLNKYRKKVANVQK